MPAPDVVTSLLRVGRVEGDDWVTAPDGLVDTESRMVEARITGSGTYGVLIPAPSLAVYAARRNVRVGAAVDAERLLTFDPTYRDLLGAEFNSVVAENAMKFEDVHPSASRFDWSYADDLVGFATERGMAVHGHTLLWHSQVPDWIVDGNWTRATLLEEFRLHVEAVVGRYRGRIESWDVANEMIADGGDATGEGLRRSQWIDVIGPDVIDSAFVWANHADPAAKLYLNDYSVEHPESNREKMTRLRALAIRLRTAGVPVHGIGLQAHLTLNAPNRAQLSETLQFFTGAGFDVRISELDVRVPDGQGDAALQSQAVVYRDVMAACLANARCTGVTTWGFTDRYSWIPQFFPGFGRALPFDASFRPKPAYASMLEALLGRTVARGTAPGPRRRRRVSRPASPPRAAPAPPVPPAPRAAIVPTAPITTATPTSVTGSCDETPNSNPATTRAREQRAGEARDETGRHQPAALANTMRWTRPGSAPRLMRMPISLVRALTENASTAAMPIAAITSARRPNDPTSSALRRRGPTLSSRIASSVITFSIGCSGANAAHDRARGGARSRLG